MRVQWSQGNPAIYRINKHEFNTLCLQVEVHALDKAAISVIARGYTIIQAPTYPQYMHLQCSTEVSVCTLESRCDYVLCAERNLPSEY